MVGSPNGRTLYVLGDRQGASIPGAVLSSFDAVTGTKLGERALGGWSGVDGLAATKTGAWVSLMMVNHRTATARVTLYKGARLARGPQIRLGHQAAATVAYVAGHVMWLIDGAAALRRSRVQVPRRDGDGQPDRQESPAVPGPC